MLYFDIGVQGAHNSVVLVVWVEGVGGMKRESLSNQFKKYRQTYPLWDK
jgi:hypothetical protein